MTFFEIITSKDLYGIRPCSNIGLPYARELECASFDPAFDSTVDLRPERISIAGRTKTSEKDETEPEIKLPTAPSSHESPSFLHDTTAMKFVNCMMWDGKKSLSQRIFRETLENIKKIQLSKLQEEGDGSVEVNPMTIFHAAMVNAKPTIGTTRVTLGGKHYHVPVELHPNRQRFLAIRWLIVAARERPGKGMGDKLALELLDAYNNEGTVIKKKQDLHRLAEANRAFAHFRW